MGMMGIGTIQQCLNLCGKKPKQNQMLYGTVSALAGMAFSKHSDDLLVPEAEDLRDLRLPLSSAVITGAAVAILHWLEIYRPITGK